ncbi:MAG TPA: hypothetical protein VKA43_17690 [Gammaproteobacteria bacterium]|nr:hypothetical protein [Gammaproteobacteria bacterium]
MVAAPVIATLSSGAALARSSSLISSTSPSGALDALGRTQCLDKRSGDLKGTVMDLGTPPSGSVTAITQRDYRTEPKGSAAPISEAEMCARGGDFYYQSSGWQTARVPRGILVSATALSSFAGSIRFTEV